MSVLAGCGESARQGASGDAYPVRNTYRAAAWFSPCRPDTAGAEVAGQEPRGPGRRSGPALFQAVGKEPAAHRLRPGRPGQHRAGQPAGAAVEPARRMGDLRLPGPPGDDQRGRLHRRPGGERAARPGRPGDAAIPAGRAAGVRKVRRLESAWANGKAAYRCRHGYTSATGSSPDPPGEPVRPPGPDPAPPGRPGHPAGASPPGAGPSGQHPRRTRWR